VSAPHGLDASDIARLTAHGHVERIARRGIVALDRPTLAVIVEGYFRIFRHAAFVRDVTLGLGSRGDILAPSVAFGDRPAETGAEALSEGAVLLLSPERWTAFAAAEPELNLKLAASIGRRVSRLQKRLEEQSRWGVQSRVAAVLVELADEFGAAAATGFRLDLPLSQEDLARLAGTTRETCSSAVAEFARRGFVRGGRLRGMLVLDREALRDLAETGAPAKSI
jgi:CRP-like cAMP-binding protein